MKEQSFGHLKPRTPSPGAAIAARAMGQADAETTATMAQENMAQEKEEKVEKELGGDSFAEFFQ